MMMTKVSYIQFDEISGVLVGEENILMTSRASLFRFFINSNVASPCRECPYFTSILPHFINWLCLIWVQSNPFEGQRTSQKAAAENPAESDLLGLSYMARQKACKSIRASTVSCAIWQYTPADQVLLYEHVKRLRSFQIWGLISSLVFICSLQPVSGCTVQTCVRGEMGLLSMLLVPYVFLLNGL